MLLTIIAEYRESALVKLLEIDEAQGTAKIKHVNPQNAEELRELKEVLDEGQSYSDFQIIHSQIEGVDSYELRHFCSNLLPGEPDTIDDNYLMQDEPSCTGFIRKMIYEGGLVVLPLRSNESNETTEIPHWGVASPNTIQFNDHFGMNIASLIPGSEPDYWRWTSSVLLMANNRDEYTDISKLVFLMPEYFDEGDYVEYLVELPKHSVVQADGTSIAYRAFNLSDKLDLYPRKSNALVTPSVMSRLKFVADSYKLALYALSTGLFEDKKIERSEYSRSSGMALGREFRMKNAVTVGKKTADAMLDFFLKSLQGETTLEQEHTFLQKYPHYQMFTSIIRSQSGNFFGVDVNKKKAMRIYRSLKNVEAYCNLMLAECKHFAIFDNNSYLFNSWVSTQSFESDIPNYKIAIGGGGGTWRPSGSYFW